MHNAASWRRTCSGFTARRCCCTSPSLTRRIGCRSFAPRPPAHAGGAANWGGSGGAASWAGPYRSGSASWGSHGGSANWSGYHGGPYYGGPYHGGPYHGGPYWGLQRRPVLLLWRQLWRGRGCRPGGGYGSWSSRCFASGAVCGLCNRLWSTRRRLSSMRRRHRSYMPRHLSTHVDASRSPCRSRSPGDPRPRALGWCAPGFRHRRRPIAYSPVSVFALSRGNDATRTLVEATRPLRP